METDIINPYVIKIIIAARNEDSINAIAKRIHLSYGWTYKWITRLIKIGVFKGSRVRLTLNQENQFYKDTIDFIKKTFSKDIHFHYSTLRLFGIKYCFTKTDAVFVWTKGGYNIARFKGHYPIFIKVKADQLPVFKEYCKKLSLKIGRKNGISYHIEILDEFGIVDLDGNPVDSLNITIKFMKKYIYNFQPALEMVQEMYGKGLKIKYKEINYV